MIWWIGHLDHVSKRVNALRCGLQRRWIIHTWGTASTYRMPIRPQLIPTTRLNSFHLPAEAIGTGTQLAFIPHAGGFGKKYNHYDKRFSHSQVSKGSWILVNPGPAVNKPHRWSCRRLIYAHRRDQMHGVFLFRAASERFLSSRQWTVRKHYTNIKPILVVFCYSVV